MKHQSCLVRRCQHLGRSGRAIDVDDGGGVDVFGRLVVVPIALHDDLLAAACFSHQIFTATERTLVEGEGDAERGSKPTRCDVDFVVRCEYEAGR
jgi:hypothetical protein